MSDYSQVPPDLRMQIESSPLLYWTKRGKCVIVKHEMRAQELTREGLLWRKVKDEEVEAGVKAGDFNPIYDMGDGQVDKIEIPDFPTQPAKGQHLEVIRI